MRLYASNMAVLSDGRMTVLDDSASSDVGLAVDISPYSDVGFSFDTCHATDTEFVRNARYVNKCPYWE